MKFLMLDKSVSKFGYIFARVEPQIRLSYVHPAAGQMKYSHIIFKTKINSFAHKERKENELVCEWTCGVQREDNT